MILSGTRALREYFDAGGVVFVDDHEPDTLAAAMRTIMSAARGVRAGSAAPPARTLSSAAGAPAMN